MKGLVSIGLFVVVALLASLASVPRIGSMVSASIRLPPRKRPWKWLALTCRLALPSTWSKKISCPAGRPLHPREDHCLPVGLATFGSAMARASRFPQA